MEKSCKNCYHSPRKRGLWIFCIIILMVFLPVWKVNAAELSEDESLLIESFVEKFNDVYAEAVRAEAEAEPVVGKENAVTRDGERIYYASEDGTLLKDAVKQIAAGREFERYEWERLLQENTNEVIANELKSALRKMRWIYSSTLDEFGDTCHKVIWNVKEETPYEVIVTAWKALYTDPVYEILPELQSDMENNIKESLKDYLNDLDKKLNVQEIDDDLEQMQKNIRVLVSMVMTNTILIILLVILLVVYFWRYSKLNSHEKQKSDEDEKTDDGCLEDYVDCDEIEERIKKIDNNVDWMVEDAKKDQKDRLYEYYCQEEKEGLCSAEARTTPMTVEEVETLEKKDGVDDAPEKETKKVLTVFLKNERFDYTCPPKVEDFRFVLKEMKDEYKVWREVDDASKVVWQLINNMWLCMELKKGQEKIGGLYTTPMCVLYDVTKDGQEIEITKDSKQINVVIQSQEKILLKPAESGSYQIADPEKKAKLDLTDAPR